MSDGYQRLLEIDLDLESEEQQEREGGESERFFERRDSQDEEQQEWEREDKKAAGGLSPSDASGSLAQQQSSSSTVGFFKKLFTPRPASQSNKGEKPETKKDSKTALPSITPLPSKDLVEERNERTNALVAAICVPYDSKDKYGSTLEYQVKKIFPFSYLLSQRFDNAQDLEKAFQHISAVVRQWNADPKNKKEKLTVEKEEGLRLSIVGMSNDLLRNFSNSQKKFLSIVLPAYLYDQAEERKSIHAFLEEEYLKKGNLGRGAAAIKGLIKEDSKKINEVNKVTKYKPLQDALSRWFAATHLANKSISADKNNGDNRSEELLDYLENGVIIPLLKHDSIDLRMFPAGELSLLLAIAVRSGSEDAVRKLSKREGVINEAVLDRLLSLAEPQKMLGILSKHMSFEFLSTIALPKIKILLKMNIASDPENIRRKCLMVAAMLLKSTNLQKKGVGKEIIQCAGYYLDFNEGNRFRFEPLGTAEAKTSKSVAEETTGIPAPVIAGAEVEQAVATSSLAKSGTEQVDASSSITFAS